MSKTSHKRKFALELIKLLDRRGFQTMFVGGCVRDSLLGLEPKDYDLASSALPDELCSIFRQNNYKTLEVGKQFGTVIVVRGSFVVEVTTLRKDTETDGRHATVSYTDCFEEDSSRRDFTINAMYQDASGKLYDFHDGQKDLANKTLRFVGDAAQRVQEDFLRILRFYRFCSTYSLQPEKLSRDACIQHRDGLQKISGERVSGELSKILSCKSMGKPQQALAADGIYQTLFAFSLKDDKGLLAQIQEVGELPLWIKRLAALLYMNAQEDQLKATISPVAKRLRLSDNDLQTLKVFSGLAHDVQKQSFIKASDSLTFLDKLEKNLKKAIKSSELLAYLRAVLSDASSKQKVSNLEEHLSEYGDLRSNFPLNGDILQKSLGIEPSAKLGMLLEDLRKAYYDNEWKSQDSGIKHAKELLKTSKFVI